MSGVVDSFLGGKRLINVFGRYISQVRQELAMRLLGRIYAGGNTPSKVGPLQLCRMIGQV